MTENTPYHGGKIQHDDTKEVSIRIEFVTGFEPIDPEAGTTAGLVAFLANALITADLHQPGFSNSPEWQLFNACSIDVRLRVFELMQQIQSRVATKLFDDLQDTRERMQKVLLYIVEHQVSPLEENSVTAVYNVIEDADMRLLVDRFILPNNEAADDFEEIVPRLSVSLQRRILGCMALALTAEEVSTITIAAFDRASTADPEKRLSKRITRKRLHWWVLESYNLAVNKTPDTYRDLEERTNLRALSEILYDMYLARYSAEEAHALYVKYLSKSKMQSDYTIQQFREWCLEASGGESVNW